jgi:hypothetical protein
MSQHKLNKSQPDYYTYVDTSGGRNRKNKIVVYTAITDNYDILYEPLYKSDKFDYVCFTDNPNLKSDFWKIITLQHCNLDATRKARYVKILPHLFFQDYKYSVWIDANIRIVGDLYELLRIYLSKSFLVFFRHSDGRNCIYQEAEACIRRKKDDENVILAQAERYKEENYPENNGLISTGVILRRHKDPKIIETMDAWWNEVKNFSKRDQMSFNYIAWKHKTPFSIIDDYIRDNKYFKWRIHDHQIKR